MWVPHSDACHRASPILIRLIAPHIIAAYHNFEEPLRGRLKIGWEREALCDRIGAIKGDNQVVYI